MYDITGKTALITGGTRGIGAAISQLLAERGCKITATYRSDSEAAKELLKSLPGQGHKVYSCDVTAPDQIAELFEKMQKEDQGLDILVNNAGIGYHHPIDKVNYQSWQEGWQQVLATNLIGPANMCYHAAALMKLQQSGVIINISSRGAYRGEPLMPAYGASKAALNSMTQSLAYQLAPYNIRVGAIAPGFVETDMSRSRLVGEIGEGIRSQSPMHRVAQPTEIAEAVLLMSQSNIWMTGSVWDINGASYFR